MAGDPTTAPAAPDRDPDVRFLLANERTLLAWLRTGLALQGGGILVVQLVTRLHAQEVLGVGLLVLGTVCHVAGWRRYRAADAAIRADRLPSRGLAPDLLVLLLVAIGAALTLALL